MTQAEPEFPTLSGIMERIVGFREPKRVILFGSRGRRVSRR